MVALRLELPWFAFSGGVLTLGILLVLVLICIPAFYGLYSILFCVILLVGGLGCLRWVDLCLRVLMVTGVGDSSCEFRPCVKDWKLSLHGVVLPLIFCWFKVCCSLALDSGFFAFVACWFIV